MAKALGAAVLDRFPDGRQAEALADMDRDVEVLPVNVLEGVEVAARRPACLRAGDVEADDAVVAVADGGLGVWVAYFDVLIGLGVCREACRVVEAAFQKATAEGSVGFKV